MIPAVRGLTGCTATVVCLLVLAGCGSASEPPVSPAVAKRLAVPQKAIVHDGLLIAQGTAPPATRILQDTRRLVAVLKASGLSAKEIRAQVNEALLTVVGACDPCVNLLLLQVKK